jgi:hypothetical protein
MKMNDRNRSINASRRVLFKSVVVSGGMITLSRKLPEGWITPVVESVVLPAHAAISAELCSTDLEGTYLARIALTFFPCDLEGPLLIERLLEIVIDDDCDVHVRLVLAREMTGTGKLTGSDFSVSISRDADCSASTAQGEGTGVVTGTVNGNTIEGSVETTVPCDQCGSMGNVRDVSTMTGDYEATKT